MNEDEVIEQVGDKPEKFSDTSEQDIGKQKDNEGSQEGFNSEEQEKILDELFGKPEQYDFKSLEIPEGVELDTEMTSEFTKIASQLNLSQKGADELMKLGINQASKIQQTLNTKIDEYVENQRQAQIEAFKISLNTDPEIGGTKLKQALIDANEAYNAFADDEVKDILAKTGLNMCPPIVKMFKRIGEQVKDDTIHQTGGDKKSRTADDWFPSMKDLK